MDETENKIIIYDDNETVKVENTVPSIIVVLELYKDNEKRRSSIMMNIRRTIKLKMRCA